MADLAKIRENDQLVHRLHGSGWEDHATDAEIDRADLLAAYDDLRAERDALKAAIERARAEHRPVSCGNARHDSGEGLHCAVCEYDDVEGNIWPCPTVRALAVPESNEDAEDTRWRRDEREIAGGFTGNEFPRLWPPRRARGTTPDAPKGGED